MRHDPAHADVWTIRRLVIDRAVRSLFSSEAVVDVDVDVDDDSATVTIAVRAAPDHEGWTRLTRHLDWRD